MIYLDNNATTAVAPEVRTAMEPFLGERYGNPSSIHRFGGMVRRSIDRAREQVAELIGGNPEEIVFTSCGSESDNTVVKGFHHLHRSDTALVTSTVEHPAVKVPCEFLHNELGVRLQKISVDKEGLLQWDELEQCRVDSHTLATFMWANNETGVLFPLADIAGHIKEKGGFVHTDAVQIVGKIPIDIHAAGIDYLSLSGHKLHAPKGVGALFIRKGLTLPPLIHGGHQENGLRAGTENVASIVGLGKACELALKALDEEQFRVRRLRDRLEKTLLASCAGAHRNGHSLQRLPNTSNISFEFIEGESILLLLDEHAIAASSGSACTTGSLEPSHVMKAMNIPYTSAHGSIRFSLSRYTTDHDIDSVIDVMPGIVDRLRELSPYVKNS